MVDDDPTFRRLAERMLAACGLAVAGEADTVAAAMAAAGSLMPAAALVALPWRPRVVLTSSDAEAASPGDVARCGAEAFVPKDQLPNTALDALLAPRQAG